MNHSPEPSVVSSSAQGFPEQAPCSEQGACSGQDVSSPVPVPVPVLAVVLCIIERDEEVLLLRRRKPPYRGYLALPGGKMHAGETVAQTAIREAQEETGLAVRVSRCDPPLTETIRETETGNIEAHFVLFPVWLEIVGGEEQAGPEGELVWAERARLGALRIVETDRMILDRRFDTPLPTSIRHMDVIRDGEAFRVMHHD